MKIGIVTWYKNGNFGGTLQAYSLFKILQSRGYNVEFINYQENYSLRKFLVKKIKNVAFAILYPKDYLSRKKILKFVKDKLRETDVINEYESLKEVCKEYDFVICGSDQIWSCTNGFEKFYFLDFVNPQKRISYAPSIGYNNIPIKFQKDFIKYIKNMNKLSIREEKGKEIIKRLTARDATVVLDPTLLITKEDWISFGNQSKKNNNSKFILCYFLKNNKKYNTFAKKMSKTSGCKLVYISSKHTMFSKFFKKNICGIEDFVYLINNSSFVLTDSFHGVSFSINLNKKFAVFKRFNDDDEKCQNSRIYNLLNIVNLNDCLIDTNFNVNELLLKKFDFEEINKNLKTERNKSISYLLSSIGGKN